MTSVQQYHNNQYANGQYHNFIPPKQPTTMLMEIANIKQEPNATNGGGVIPPTSLAAINFQEMFEKEKKASKFKCDICGKFFAKKPTLKLHMR